MVTTEEALRNCLKQLEEGMTRVGATATHKVSGFGETKSIKITAYWVGTVARIDIKGLK